MYFNTVMIQQMHTRSLVTMVIGTFVVVATIVVIFGGSMAFGKTLVVCPAFNGQLVTSSGTPVPGVTVQRKWTWGWKDETGQDNATSAADGTFSFTEITRKSLTANLIPHEPSMTERISAVIEGEEKLLWLTGKQDYQPDTSRPAEMLCYIDREPTYTDSTGGTCIPKPQ